MKVHELITTNLNDELRFYDESDITDSLFIDEYTPFKWLTKVNLNREVKHFFITTTTTEDFYNDIEDYWISVILKEEEK